MKGRKDKNITWGQIMIFRGQEILDFLQPFQMYQPNRLFEGGNVS